MIPLILKLKKTAHKKIASAQDLIVMALYEVFDKAVLHGGTAIWRCYNGNRFSEDVDVYIPKDMDKINLFFENISGKGFAVEKKKITPNSIFSVLNFEGTIVRFEALFKKIDGSLKEYETVDGNFITVYTLEPEELAAEKINAYLKRLKIRDIYDLFFLMRHIKDKSRLKNEIKRLIAGFKKPVDESELKALLLEGLVPSSEKMMDYIKTWS